MGCKTYGKIVGNDGSKAATIASVQKVKKKARKQTFDKFVFAADPELKKKKIQAPPTEIVTTRNFARWGKTKLIGATKCRKCCEWFVDEEFDNHPCPDHNDGCVSIWNFDRSNDDGQHLKDFLKE